MTAELELGANPEVSVDPKLTPENFAIRVTDEIAPQIERYSLTVNPELFLSDIEKKLEHAKESSDVADVLGEAVVLDDPNLAHQVLSSKVSKDLALAYTQEGIFAAAVAKSKANFLEKQGFSGKARRALKKFKDDVLWFLTGNASSPEATRKRQVAGSLRKRFLRNAALTASALVLAACGVNASAGSPIPDSEPIRTSTPTPLPPEATVTAPVQVTETATATEEGQKVYTQAELEAMVPTKEEMIVFLNSDEIVRITDPLTQGIVPLGVKEIDSGSYELGTGYSAIINILPWGEPVLADIKLDDGEPLRTMLVPVVFVQGEDFSKPTFLYIIAGDEGKSSLYADIAYGEQGTNTLFADTLVKLSWYIERGRQTEIYFVLHNELFEPFNEQVYRDYLTSIDYPEGLIDRAIYSTQIRTIAGKSFLETARNLRSKIPVADGSYLGVANIFSFQGIGHPNP